MSSVFFIFFLSSLLSFVYIVYAQERSPHGLAYESPMVLSPSAIEFFHPKSSSNTAAAPLPLFSSSTAVAQSTLAHESKRSTSGNGEVGIGGVVGIVFGFVVAVVLAMGVYYVVVTRRTNTTRTIAVQPDHHV